MTVASVPAAGASVPEIKLPDASDFGAQVIADVQRAVTEVRTATVIDDR